MIETNADYILRDNRISQDTYATRSSSKDGILWKAYKTWHFHVCDFFTKIWCWMQSEAM